MIKFLLIFFISFSVYASDRYSDILNTLTKGYILSYTDNNDVVAELLVPRKHIVLNRGYMDKLSDKEVAWVLAHELGHIHTLTVRNHYEDELRADRFALRLVNSAGYNMTREDMVSIGKKIGLEDFDKDFPMHPSWNKRIDNMFPQQKIVVNNGVIIIK